MMKPIPRKAQSVSTRLIIGAAICVLGLPVCGQSPLVELSFSEAVGAATVNSGSLGGSGIFAQTDWRPVSTNRVPVGAFAPGNNVAFALASPDGPGGGGPASSATANFHRRDGGQENWGYHFPVHNISVARLHPGVCRRCPAGAAMAERLKAGPIVVGESVHLRQAEWNSPRERWNDAIRDPESPHVAIFLNGAPSFKVGRSGRPL